MADFIERDAYVADIGTDHGYLPVYLAQTKRAGRIIASDISAGSLRAAQRSAEKYNVEDKITLINAPGLDGIGEDDVDTIVIAGVGGETIIEILENALWTKAGKRLILQPQTKKQELLSWLLENDYAVVTAKQVLDRGKQYTVLCVESKGRRKRGKMATVNDIFDFLNTIAPTGMKTETDNVGFLVGQGDTKVSKIIVALDITSDVIAEAIECKAQLIVSHHPLFFSLKSVTDGDVIGRKIVKMLSEGLSGICMHTNLDAVHGGVNDVLARAAGIESSESTEFLSKVLTLESGETYAMGRVGYLENPCSMQEYLSKLKKVLNTNGLRYYDAGREVYKVAVMGGSGSKEFQNAVRHDCDTFISADIAYHLFLDARELGINLIDADHFCTENVVIPIVAEKLCAAFPEVQTLVSKRMSQTAKFY